MSDQDLLAWVRLTLGENCADAHEEIDDVIVVEDRLPEVTTVRYSAALVADL
jgi:hypothetical protein